MKDSKPQSCFCYLHCF